MDLKAIASRIDQAAKKTKKSNEFLGSRIDVSHESVRGWRKGKHTPRLDKLEAFAKELNVSERWILFGDDDGLPNDIEKRHSDLLKAYLRLPGELRTTFRMVIESVSTALNPSYQITFKEKEKLARKKINKATSEKKNA